MIRLSAIFVGLCMALIAGSLGTVLYLFLGMTGAEASIVALAAFTGLAVYNTNATRARDRGDLTGQIADLSRGTVDLARQVTDLGRRLAVVDAKAEKAMTEALAGQALAAEIDELAGLIDQIATSVAAHDTALSGALDAISSPAKPMIAEQRAPAAVEAAEAVMRPAPEEHPDAGATRPQASSQAVAPMQNGRAEARSAPPLQGHAAPAPAGGSGDQNAVIASVREAVSANRIELHLQPIVGLPQRKVKYYEAFARLRSAEGDLLLPADFLAAAEAAGVMPRIDNAILLRCVQAAQRLMGNNREVGLFCNLSPTTLADHNAFYEFIAVAEANRAVAPALVFEFAQAAFRGMGPIEMESLSALASRGYRFSLDQVGDLRFEPRDLAERGFRFVKVPAGLLLGRNAPAAADIHPADLSGLLARYNISLIAEKIEQESTLVDLLDYDVKLGQGFLFAAPRLVRQDVLQPPNERRDLSGTDMPRARIVTPAAVPSPGPRPAAAPTGLASPGSALAQLARTMIARK